MKIIQRFILAMLCFGGLLACQREEIMLVDENVASLDFPKTKYLSIYKSDSLQFLALFNSGVEEATLYIPIRLSGKIADVDRKYKMRIVAEESFGVTEGTHFTLEKEQVLHAGRYIDSTILKIDAKAVMKDEVDGRLYIELVPNENFVKGIDFYQYMIVRISGAGLTSQPTFWNKNSLGNYAGTYSAVKAEKFIELNNIPAADWLAPNKSILFAYAKKTYEWFENNPTYENGERVVFKGVVEF